ncbi:MAG TPA: SNF2-related protein [Thermomicrobiales bacterium]|jgi:adenine-specific DNA-methyltransferase|nr:SNF2-related protein [Thermomicrobiales bacterium]
MTPTVVSDLSDHQACYFAHELSRRHAAGDPGRLTGALADAQVDLNPHQVDAALFAFRSPTTQGVLIADEVGLGKTIEAGLVLAQHWAERKRHLLAIVPANLRKQWSQELLDKFALPSVILEASTFNAARRAGIANPFESDGIVLCSYQFARKHADLIRRVAWDLVVMDEAHHVRNVYRSGNVTARELRGALAGRRKVLLTATPLQNNLVELYGLVSFLDEHAFADEKSFREQYARGRDNRLDELKERIRPFCHRTLRRQVLPYVRYTERRPLLQTFTPSEDEAALYDMVSDYLQRDSLRAIPTNQRALTTMVLRKLLASSSYAIAGALTKMTDRLAGQLDGRADEAPVIAELGEDYDTLDETAEDWDGSTETVPTEPDQQVLRDEIEELVAFRDLARQIRDNAKGRALLAALQRGFAEAEQLGAPRKAIIFTESRRTQEYLHQLLLDSEFRDGIVLFNGSNGGPQARPIYEAWRARHAGTDHATGVRAADTRAALVEYFRDEGQIMIATEAGAEGINLQFCSLVVNYDLPWNPQRIEQRIGRCHRYGQKHDVVVVNFLNETNEADRRVHELLEQKFQLFQGVFGASDEVLGSVGNGVDFERRIGDIYQTCRTQQDIANAFDALQREMSGEISTEMTRTRASLLEHFDEEVTERLRQHEAGVPRAISRQERALMRLTRHELRGVADFTSERTFTLPGGFDTPHGPAAPGTYAIGRGTEADHHYRIAGALAQHVIESATSRPLAPARITLDYAAHGARISELQRRVGTSGWLRASRLTIAGQMSEEDHLVLAVTCDDSSSMDAETARQLLTLPAAASEPVTVDGTIAARLTAMTDQLTAAELAAAAERQQKAFLEEIAKLDAWAQDQRVSLKVSVTDLEDQLKAVRREIRAAGGDMARVLTLRRQQNQLSERIEEREAEIRAENRRIRREQDALIDEIEHRLQNANTTHDLFTVRWKLV